MLRLVDTVHKMLTNKLLRLILRDTALANKAYYEIRENCMLVSCGYKLAGKARIFVEHYLDTFHKCEYFALFPETPNSYIPLTITRNEIS